MMSLDAPGAALIKSFESCSLVAYPDQRGIPTLGWGHTAGVQLGDTCTQAQADAWFLSDTLWACQAITNQVDVGINQNQFDALTSLVFDIGVGAFGSSTLLRVLNAGNLIMAAEQFLVWNHVNGVVNAGLTQRREAERALFLS